METDTVMQKLYQNSQQKLYQTLLTTKHVLFDFKYQAIAAGEPLKSLIIMAIILCI